jgi:hypothetical protein
MLYLQCRYRGFDKTHVKEVSGSSRDQDIYLGIAIPSFLFMIFHSLQDTSSQGSSITYQLSFCLQNFMPIVTIALYNLHSFKKLIKKSP